MPIDIAQFLQTFIDESMEMLQEAESVFLTINLNQIDPESIHKVFRVMHSIKGSSAVFKLDVMSQLTHTLEDYLTEVKNKHFSLNQQEVDLLLCAIDCLRTMLTALQNKTELNEQEAKQLTLTFKEKLKKNNHTNNINNINTPISSNNIKKPIETPTGTKWHVSFSPPKNSLLLKNEPLRLFQTLSQMGKFFITLNKEKLPDFSSFDPSQCYLSWEIDLDTVTDKTELMDLFYWITNDEYFTVEAAQSNPLIQTTSIMDTAKSSVSSHTSSIRVATEKIDNVINYIGELVITKSMLNQLLDNFSITKLNLLKEEFLTLDNQFRELQEYIMRIRMLPIGTIFNRFSRIVHDLAEKTHKKVELRITGDETEIDKNMIEKLTDPIQHIIRNALDHGIEAPDLRQKNNKPEIGIIQLHASQMAGHVVIEISDDGSGLNKEKIKEKAILLHLMSEKDEMSDEKIYEFIFYPGFSTTETISTISGRGVGMDVVHKNIMDLGGEIEIKTKENVGTTFRLKLPLTLSIMDCQLVKIHEQVYIVPLINIAQMIKIDPTYLNKIDQHKIVYYFSNEYIPIINLKRYFSSKKPNEITSLPTNKQFLLIVKTGIYTAGIIVDELLTQQQVVIKNLNDNYKKIPGTLGATILGNGQVALILDVKSIVQEFLSKKLPKKTHEKPIEYKKFKNIFLQEEKEFLHLLTFRLFDHVFGVDILLVREIRTLKETLPIPDAPSYLKGMINIRGNIIPILDLHKKFGLTRPILERPPLIIILMIPLQFKNRYFGIIADQVSNDYLIKREEIQPIVLNKENNQLKKYLLGLVTIEKDMVCLINVHYLSAILTKQESVS